jgi:dephospho-CoA kinase
MILGVTGGIACGKSSVVQFFRQLGAAVVSADELAREVVAPGSATLQALVAHFGSGILLADGSLDRAGLAARVFAAPAERAVLEAITHPAIKALADARLQALAYTDVPLIVYEAPLLFEAGAQGRVDAVAVVAVGAEQQLQRLMARDRMSVAEAQARIAAQMPLAEKIARADFVIDNSGSEEETAVQVRDLFSRLVATMPGRSLR